MSNGPLGIKYDYWHFILAMISFLAISLTLTFIMDLEPQIVFFSAITAGFFGTTWLQFGYECRQLYSTSEIYRHGGFDRFVSNSRRDTRLALAGILVGITTYTILYIFLHNMEVL